MDHRRLDLIQIFESRGNLHDDGSSLSLRDRFVLLQVEVQVMPRAILQHRAEGIGIYLKHVIESNNARMLQPLVDLVFSQGMPTPQSIFSHYPDGRTQVEPSSSLIQSDLDAQTKCSNSEVPV